MYGPFGNLFPYSDQHALNLDWIIQVAKDFLDQYTHIQEVISDGETSLDQHTADGLAALAAEKTRLEGLLDAWYNTHSEDIADQLTAAVASFQTQATDIVTALLATIPSDYTALSASVTELQNAIKGNDLVDNLYRKYINYNYDTSYNLEAVPDSSTATQLGVSRLFNNLIINGTATANRTIKASGTVGRGGITGPSSYTDGVTLTVGRTYKATLKYISGTYTIPEGKAAPAALSVYRLGETSSVGEFKYENVIDMYRIFTADTTTYNLVLYVNSGASFTNVKYVLLLEDITDFTKEEVQLKVLQIDAALSNAKNDYRITGINYGYNTSYSLYSTSTTGSSSVRVWRRGTDIILKVPDTNNNNVRVKINGEVKRTTSDSDVESWTSDSVSLTAGKNYTIRYISLNSDETVEGLSISVYRTGESSTIGASAINGNVYSKTFTAEEDTTYEFYLYVRGHIAIDAEIAVILSEEVQEPVNENIYTEEINKTIEETRAELTEPAFVFMMTTDNHRFKADTQNFEDQIANMKLIAAAVKTDAVMDLGDLIEGDQLQAVTTEQAYSSIDLFRTLNIPYLFTCGNHDINPYSTSDQVYTKKQVYQIYFPDVKKAIFDAGAEYSQYYIDYDEIGLRVIALNSCYIRHKEGGLDYYGFPNSVSTFLSDALNTNYKVLMISHLASTSTQVWNSPSIDNRTDVNNAIQTFINNGGSLIQLSGHSHIDVAFINPWLSIASTCQRFQNVDLSNAGYAEIVGYIDEKTAPTRSNSDYTKDAWTMCVYKPASNDLSLIRFGAGSNRYFHNTPIAPTTVTTKLTDTITWSSSDNTIATVANGVITGVSTGRCAILAKDEHNNYECWTVEVE